MPQVKEEGGWTISRRRALQAFAGAASFLMTRCDRPDEDIFPYVNMPEELVPGDPVRFATALPLGGYARGAVGITIDGRPIKIEGNPRHPFSLGASDVFMESEVLSLYDPDRSKTPHHKGIVSGWNTFWANWRAEAEELARRQGRGLALVTGRVVSPTTLRSIDILKSRFPEMRWHRYESLNDDNARAGGRMAFGRHYLQIPRLSDVDVAIALDADPFGPGPLQLANARAYATRKKAGNRPRLYVAEPIWTLTGAAADERIALRPEAIGEIARALAKALGADLAEAELPESARAFTTSAARDLNRYQGRALLLAGSNQPPAVHALCHWINERIGAPIDHIIDPDPHPQDHAESMTAFLSDLHDGHIDALLIVGANPVYDLGNDENVARAIASVPFSVHAGTYRDESAQHCAWHLPLSHILETWGDLRAPDGTASLVQPLIRPLYDTRTCDQILVALTGDKETSAYDITRAIWREQTQGDFDHLWRHALHNGVIEESAAPVLHPKMKWRPVLERPHFRPGIILATSPDPSVWDGLYANNAWLQECPKPFTKEVWGNAVSIAPVDAARLNLRTGDGLKIKYGAKQIENAVVISEGQAEGVIHMTRGYGRMNAGAIGSQIGVNVAQLASSLAPTLFGIEIERGRCHSSFLTTQAHTQLEGDLTKIFPVMTSSMPVAHKPSAKKESLLPEPQPGEYAWAMVIDTDACIGCNACVVACQAENNVPVVGPDEIARGRSMHWLRIDSYMRDSATKLIKGFQPVPCMQCELAPCEPVCPVEASVHDHQGINVQVYNRCIGTRFCEANCPYKVRRFNWFAYSGPQAYANLGNPLLAAQRNPDVSVRERGVMEKCNYCLQRINRARRDAQAQNRAVGPDEVVTACQAACPTRAIHFGDLNNSGADVAKLRRDPHHYVLLEELNTRPRTTYLKRIVCPSSDNEPEE